LPDYRDFGHLYPFSETSYAMVAGLVNHGQFVGNPITYPSVPIKVPEILIHPDLQSSYDADGLFSPPGSYTRLIVLMERVMTHRRANARPYLESKQRDAIKNDLDGWFRELPPAFQTMDLKALATPDWRITETSPEEERLVGLSAAVMLIFHMVHVMLSSPSDLDMWSPSVPFDWIGAPAFLVCQEHAIRATALLRAVTHLSVKLDALAAIFFQFCCVRTGLVHHKYMLAAQAARVNVLAAGGQTESYYEPLIEQAAQQISIHTLTLEMGQQPNFSDGMTRWSYWYSVWRTFVLGIPSMPPNAPGPMGNLIQVIGGTGLAIPGPAVFSH
jgi:hypothetical protein